MKKAVLAVAALAASATQALAVPTNLGISNPPAVPEISALEGTAALAVVAAIVLIAWERRRKAA